MHNILDELSTEIQFHWKHNPAFKLTIKCLLCMIIIGLIVACIGWLTGGQLMVIASLTGGELHYTLGTVLTSLAMYASLGLTGEW